MKTLYIECAMGAAGDMLMGALYQLCPQRDQFLEEMNHLLPGVKLEAEAVQRHSIAGTHMHVYIHGEEEGHEHDHHHDHEHDHCHEHDHHDHEHCHDHGHGHDHDGHHHHHGRSLQDVQAMIDALPFSDTVRKNAAAVYGRIAAAESRAHGMEVGEVHFHEVGALDAVIDVTGVCRLMELMAPDRVVVSPVTVGFGTVNTAHGLLAVPAPATASLLEGVPMEVGSVEAELCTPTGAALVTTFGQEFGRMPKGRILGCGVGCGTKDFPRANVLRVFLLDEAEPSEGPNDQVVELKANIDDMTGEALGYAMDRLLEEGALDVSYLPLQMKKNRPGVLLLCLCREADSDRLARAILRETTTMGVRRTLCDRYALAPAVERVNTPLGEVRMKCGSGYGLAKRKPEYDDAAALAREKGLPLREVLRELER